MSGERIGLYPGTFDPVTLGHLDIIERAVKLVDHLVIGIANNPSKTQAFTLKERVAMMRRETLDPEIETVFLMADPRHQAIASRLVKEIAAFGGDVAQFTTPAVAKALKTRYGK